jgi:L-iditol 2-dehydrogenase
MKAAALTALKTIEMVDVPAPRISGGKDVLLDVVTVGVCGSDVHYYNTGRIGSLVVKFPYRVGHEFAGRVVAVGPAVTRVKPGDLVAVDPLAWCGTCDQCLTGRFHTCRNQAFLGCPGQSDGCLCEQIVMPEESCFLVPEGMSADLAALAEPFTIGYYAAHLAGLLPDCTGAAGLEGKTVAILGAGPIGLCVMAACKAMGAAKAYLTDIREARVDFARTFGADGAGNPETENIVENILDAEPLGVDIAFECCGKQSAVDEAVELLKPGGKLMLVGIPEAERTSVIICHARRKELTIQNVRRQNECVEPALEMIAAGRVRIDSMMTHHYPLDRTAEAFEIVAGYADGVIKAMIHVKK